MSKALCTYLNVILTCSTALQAVMDRMELMERSMEQMRVDHEESMKELREENQRSINIGPEMDQEIDTVVHQ